MAGFNFRIGTKLGITSGISVLLVGGMLANQLIGNHVVTESSQKVVLNGLNKANAQSAETAMLAFGRCVKPRPKPAPRPSRPDNAPPDR